MISPARHLTMNGHQSNQKAMKKIIIIASLIGGSLLLAGCQKEFGKGGEVRFVASSVAGPQTRAEYSGEGTQDPNNDKLLTWERIAWQTGDVLRIWSDAAKTPDNVNYSDYKVSSFNVKSGDNTRSQATVENAAGNGLTWDGVTGNCGFWAVYPASMAGTGTTNEVDLSIAGTQTPSDNVLASAPMVAAVNGVEPNSSVTLEFYPAFTAFEITLKSADQGITLNSFTLTSTSTALSGSYIATIATGGNTTYTCPSRTAANGKVEYTFASGTTISKMDSTTFTILALPQVLKDLTIEFNVTMGSTTGVRKLDLKKNGSFINFAACSKHRIYGLAMPGNEWNFKYITLENQVIAWTDEEVEDLDTDNLPEASQFVVNGANNGRYYTSGDQTSPVSGRNATAYRQYWLMKSVVPTTVTFKIMAPEGGTYEVVPQGNTGEFTITGNLEGEIAAKPESADTPSTTTVVNLTITSTTTTTDAKLYFKTYVTDKNGNKYNIDSETQLFDLRGYHYFVMNNSTTVR